MNVAIVQTKSVSRSPAAPTLDDETEHSGLAVAR